MKENSFKKSIFKSEKIGFEEQNKQGSINQHSKAQGYDEDLNTSTSHSSICKNCQKFEVLMRKMIKEKEQLVFEISYKEIALKKREELMTHYATESQQLKHSILNLKNKIIKLEAQLEQQQPEYTARSFFSKNSQNILRAASLNSAQVLEKEENKKKQSDLVDDMKESIKKLQKDKSINQEEQVEYKKEHYPNRQQREEQDEQINQQENKALQQKSKEQQNLKAMISQSNIKNVYKIDIPQSKSKTLVDLSRGYPKVIKSTTGLKGNAVGNDNSNYNKEQELLFNYDKYDHFVLKNQSNTERKAMQPPQYGIYRNLNIKIKKKQRSAQSVSDISQIQRGVASYTPTKFVERDQIQREQDAKSLIHKLSQSSFSQTQQQMEQQSDVNGRPSSNLTKQNEIDRPNTGQIQQQNDIRSNSSVIKTITDNQNRPNSALSNTQNINFLNRPQSSGMNNFNNENCQLSGNQSRPNTGQINSTIQINQDNDKQRSKSATHKVQTQTPSNINAQNNTQDEQKHEKVNIMVNNLPIQNLSEDKRDKTPEKMDGSQTNMNNKYRPSRDNQNGEFTNKNITLTPPTNRSSLLGRKSNQNIPAIQQQRQPRKSFYGTLETFQSDDHLDKSEKQEERIEELSDEDAEKNKGMNFTQAISRQSPCNSPQMRQLTSSGSNRNQKQNTSFMMSSSQNQNISTPNRMYNSQRSPQRVSKRYQTRKLEDIENQIMFLTNEQDLKKAKKNPRNYWIGDFVEDSSQFFYKLSLQPADQQISFAESIQKLLTDYVISLDYGLMLKKSLESCAEVSKSLRFNEILSNLHDQLIRNINCQKIFFYIYDEKTKELWSTKSDNSVIRIKPQRGLLKHIVTTLEKIKVDDIAFDPRFDPEIDSMLHPDIKSLLLIPLLNYQNGLMGVVQIVNLNYKSKAKYVYDQMKVENIIRVSGNIISIGMIYEQNFLNNQRIMRLLSNNIRLFEIEQIDELMAEVQEALVDIFGTQKCVAYLINQNNMLERFKKIYTEEIQTKSENKHNNNNQDTKKKKFIIESETFDLRTGIIGLSISSKQELEILDPQVYSYFNPLTDLDTYLPTYTLPIISNNQVLGAFQVAYHNTQLGKKVLKMESLYKEIIQHVGNLIGNCLERLLKYNQDVSEKIQAEKKIFTQEIEQLKVKLLKQRSNSTKSVVSPVQMSRSNRGPVYNSQQQIYQQSNKQIASDYDLKNKRLIQQSSSSHLGNSKTLNNSQNDIQLNKVKTTQEKILNESYQEYQQNKQKMQQSQYQSQESSKNVNKTNNQSIIEQQQNQEQNEMLTKQFPSIYQESNLHGNKQESAQNNNKVQNDQQNAQQSYSNNYINSRSQHSKINPKTQNEGLQQIKEESYNKPTN